jgi:glycerol-3-phosphate dehydrogenase
LNDSSPIYDLVVVGAGIHGAGVAQAAAVKGHSALVIEKREAAGLETSSASSKLIHGGLRYLETAQFRLVYECLREQRLLLRNAPHLVRRSAFYIPVYRDSQRHPAWIYLGLHCYRLLSGWRREDAIRTVPRDQWPQLGIRQENLRAVFRYFDAQTDDQQLTRAVLQSAEKLGAQVRFQCAITRATKADGLYELTLTDGSLIRCRTLVNAAGPWANAVAAVLAAPQQPLDWVQGVHLVLERPSPASCFYLESPRDKRAVFVLPWKGKTLVGTTSAYSISPKRTSPKRRSTICWRSTTTIFRSIPRDHRISWRLLPASAFCLKTSATPTSAPAKPFSSAPPIKPTWAFTAANSPPTAPQRKKWCTC